MRTNETKNEINDIKKWESKIKWKDLKYEAKNYIYDLQRYDTAITPFVDNICSGKININEVEIDETNLLKTWEEFSEKSRPRTKRGKGKKRNTFKTVNALYKDRELILNAFRSGAFSIK